MNKQIIALLQKMNDGASLSQTELMRLIVYDLVEPKIHRPGSLIPEQKEDAQSDYIITPKGSQFLKNSPSAQ